MLTKVFLVLTVIMVVAGAHRSVYRRNNGRNNGRNGRNNGRDNGRNNGYGNGNGNGYGNGYDNGYDNGLFPMRYAYYDSDVDLPDYMERAMLMRMMHRGFGGGGKSAGRRSYRDFHYNHALYEALS